MRIDPRRFVLVMAMAATAIAVPAAVYAGMSSTPSASPAVTAPEMTWSQSTPSYTVELDIGPAATMMMSTPTQASSTTSRNSMSGMSGMSMSRAPASTSAMSSMAPQASMSMSMSISGEVMVQMPGMTMPSMAMTDQGQPVNHHMEVHLKDAVTGAVLSNLMPVITIANASGATRSLGGIAAMYDPTVGQSDFHFGNNVYLPDGTYTVTVSIGSETASFSNLNVSGGAPLPPTGS